MSVTLRQLVAGCPACQHRRGETHTAPWSQPGHRAHTDGHGWLHSHPVTAETEALLLANMGER